MPAPDARVHAERVPALPELRGLGIVAPSLTAGAGVQCALADTDDGRRLAALAPGGDAGLDAFEGQRGEVGGGTLLVGPTSARNAAALRGLLPWLAPRPLGLRGSIGLGDRLGLATPGHVRAVRAAGSPLAPIFAQQSIRELERTSRAPQEVIDDATWGVFAEGWRADHGADADHLKEPEHIERCLSCGFTLFTVDPGDHVRDGAESSAPVVVRAAVDALPWARLRDTPRDMLARYAGARFDLGNRVLTISEDDALRAAAKYGPALVHVLSMFEHLRDRAGGRAFELEVSVDETQTPTTHAQHVYIATELRRLGVDWVSLAPRFIGRFEKGVDYIGDVAAFTADVALHAAIAERLGPYKLSLHSGSDKFSIYPALADACARRVHVKTSGTSYLEALRTVAADDPAFVRRVYALARASFARDRDSYHLSVDEARAPDADGLSDADVEALLDDDDARRILHVTFGSVLGEAQARDLGAGLLTRLRAMREPYAQALERHLARHLRPFA
jgi:hypothetical protein